MSLRLSVLALIGTLTLSLLACQSDHFTKDLEIDGRLVSKETLNVGKQRYDRFCAGCHGPTGAAETYEGRQLLPRPTSFKDQEYKHVRKDGKDSFDQQMANIIKVGIPGTSMRGWPKMPPEELDAIIQYIKTFH